MTVPQPSADHRAAATFRSRLRKTKIAARMALTVGEHAQASAAIENHLATLLSGYPPQAISFCWPLRGEFDCRPLIARLLVKGWQAVQPVVIVPHQPMEFRSWTPETLMTQDHHGIPVPTGKRVAPPDVMLLPLVAFDLQGYRLGYGGGYFDRTLAVLTLRPLAIGVGFELARVELLHPQAHDIRLDIIITEAAVRTMS
jgi:5,10-methenyltetrahydrofolate synthetase